MDQGDAEGLPIVGWREWVRLPQLGVKRIKAKVDTGARSSSLHAFDIEKFERDAVEWVRFSVHPVQRKDTRVVQAEARVLEHRSIRSSSGEEQVRPVVLTDVVLLGKRLQVELTLANRDLMGFRMLLGREAIRGRFLVDSGSSYFGGKLRKRPKT